MDNSPFRAARILSKTDHRPWAVPDRPWVMTQRWRDLLFAHWPLHPEVLRPLIPPQLALDTFDGEAWIGIVPFRMSHLRLRGLPRLPCLWAFPELNVRTYVKAGEQPGVHFFSLDAAHALAVAVARRWYRLPYFRARMVVRRRGQVIEYDSRRRGTPVALRARYHPVGPPVTPSEGSLEHWLTERYCLYVTDRRGGAWRSEIHHAPWPLQEAESSIPTNTMAVPLGLRLPDSAPLLHFASRQDVLVWRPKRVQYQTRS